MKKLLIFSITAGICQARDVVVKLPMFNVMVVNKTTQPIQARITENRYGQNLPAVTTGPISPGASTPLQGTLFSNQSGDLGVTINGTNAWVTVKNWIPAQNPAPEQMTVTITQDATGKFGAQ